MVKIGVDQFSALKKAKVQLLWRKSNILKSQISMYLFGVGNCKSFFSPSTEILREKKCRVHSGLQKEKLVQFTLQAPFEKNRILKNVDFSL